MPNYSLRTRAWALRVHSAFSIAAAIVALYLFAVGLMTHHYPGLSPEPLAYVQQQETKPSETHFKAALRPVPDHWDIATPPSLTLDLENGSPNPATFTPTLSSTGSCFIPSLNSPENTPIKVDLAPHTTGTLTLPLNARNCEDAHLPQQLLLSLSYTWTRRSFPAKTSRSATKTLHLSTSSPDKSTALDLSVRLPSTHPPTRRAASTPPRSWSGAITLSPIEVSTPNERAIRRFYNISTSAAKDFTWPILLALLAASSQIFLARRGEQQQILQTLLPTMVELMQAYYLPIARRMQRVNIEMASFSTLTPPNAYLSSQPLRRTFIAILLMRRQILHLVNNKGGVFFRTRLGEDLFSIAVGDFYSQFMTATADGDLCEQLALKLTVEDLPHQAEPKILPAFPSLQVKQLFENFANWAIDANGNPRQDFRNYLVLLDLCQAVLSFEFDRVFYQTRADDIPSFRSWYFDAPVFRFSGNPNNIPHSLRDEMLPLYRSYLNNMPAACRKGVLYP